MIESARSGAWVTPRRLTGYPLVFLLVFLVITAGALVMGQGPLDPSGKPLGTDFLSFWSVSNPIRQGQPAAVYDHGALQALEHNEAALLGLAIAALAADGLRQGIMAWEISILAFVWLTPIAWRPLADLTYIPLGWASVLMNLGLAVSRASSVGHRGA